MLHPGVIDELADEQLLHGRFDAAGLHRASSRNATPAGSAPARPTRSSLLDTLRRAHHAEVFRTLVRDVEGHITVEQVADDLSALADATLSCALRWAWKHLKSAHRARAAARGHRLRQARRQGARLRQRPRRRLPLRRSRDRRRQGGRGLRRLRAQADQLADDAHRRRRAVRHRHRAAAERQLGPARHLDRLVRELPDRPRQQHRLDLGAPGADAGALVRRARAAGAALRGGAPQRPRGAARSAGPAPPKSRRCARRCAPRTRSRPGAST